MVSSARAEETRVWVILEAEGAAEAMTLRGLTRAIAMFGVVWGCLWCGAAHAQEEAASPRPPSDTVLLRYKPVLGDTVEYQFDFVSRFDIEDRIGIRYDRTDVTMLARVTQKVTEVRPDETAVVDTTSQLVEMTPESDDEFVPIRNLITMDNQRRLLEIVDAPGENTAETDAGWRNLVVQAMNSLSFPDEPIRIGDRWERIHTLTMPETGTVTEMEVKSQLTDRMLDGDRWVSLVSAEAQIPLDLRTGDTRVAGNIGLHLRLEVYEDDGGLRYVRGWGRGSAKPDLKVRVAKIRIVVDDMHFQRFMPDGSLLPSVKGEDAPKE